MRDLLKYLLFVVVPIAGVILALQLGRNLRAPRAVHGAYTLELPPGPCQALAGDSALILEQSGPRIVARIPRLRGAELTGTVSGDSLILRSARQTAARAGSGCVEGNRLLLSAIVNHDSDTRTLTGVISIPACTECIAAAFTARRLSDNGS